MDYNINEVDDYQTNLKINENQGNIYKNNNDNIDEGYDILFNDEVDKNSIKQQNPNIMKPNDLSLEKELLAQSKRSININEENDYLKNRKWDYLDNTKTNEINEKIKIIFRDMNQNQLKCLTSKIKQCKLEYFYNKYNPRENINRIGAISGLKFLIETTYYTQPIHIPLMFSDKTKLEPYLYKYRNILGDGDCFYRGLIFSFLENIILTKNTMLLKELMILYDEKININNPLIKEKEYLQQINSLNINIVTQILYVLLINLEEDVKAAYKILIKVFLYAEDFDRGIIYFTRYLLFEYILSNENNIYSMENKINIGCLLPEAFVVDKGETSDFLFENYYRMQLMKPKTFAEKIVIYLAPFVFNYDINILIYDYGANCFIEEKTFSGEKKSTNEINLLFRKSHYDVYYKKNYFDKYREEFEILNNIYEEIKFLNSDNPDQILAESINNIILNGNNNNKKKTNSEDYEQIFADQENNDKYDNTPRCLECKQPYNNIENVFGLCNNCLLTILNTLLLSNYISFLQKSSPINNSEEKLINFFKSKNCSISVIKDIPISTAILNSGFKFKDLFMNIKKTICLYCGFNIDNDNFFIELPCNCRICKKECFDGYMFNEKKYIYNNEQMLLTIGLNSLSCPCGVKQDLTYCVSVIEKLDKLNLKKYSEIYYTYIELYWKWKCMICKKKIYQDTKFYRLILKDNSIKKLLKKKIDLKHLICCSCAGYNQIDNNKKINCLFCKSVHEIDDILQINNLNQTESTCIII